MARYNIFKYSNSSEFFIKKYVNTMIQLERTKEKTLRRERTREREHGKRCAEVVIH